MPLAASAGARLYYEDTGTGFPIVFVHEFAGEARSWEPQVRFFARRHRCITYNARGYPPSDVPADPALYSQGHACDDIAAVMRAAGVDKAHIVGLSMGGFATVHFGMKHPALARSLIIAGCGYGAKPDTRAAFQADTEELARRYDAEGAAAVGAFYAEGAARIQFKTKDPRGWAEFKAQLCLHDAKGAANTLRGVQKMRPSLWDLVERLARITAPTLIVNGDEDDHCLEAGLLLKRTIPTAGLWVMPKTGHTLNLEEPAAFNAALAEFFAMVETGRWGTRAFAPGGSAMLSGAPGPGR
ncbi:MAG: alpha/beta fold hydrolase [Alphaproteobacteria bacterium]|nr:alpha/beta fold hydrolase [Alphaproteobacteria bacterium]